MARLSSGQQWEDFLRRHQEAGNRELEAQRAAAHREMKEVRGMHSLTSASAALPVGGAHQIYDTRPLFHRRQEDMPELEVRRTPPPQYRQQSPLTSPASEGEAPNADSSVQIRQLQKKVTHKESKIKRLESEVELEKVKRGRLQAERHEAVDAQRRAEDELEKLKKKVANIDELLNASIKREKDLESELDDARQMIAELKRQLYEERCNYESDIRAKEMRERQIMQRLEDTHCALEDEVGRNRRSTRDVGSTLESETQYEPSRSRRSDKSTSGKTYISVPKGGNRRCVYMFT